MWVEEFARLHFPPNPEDMRMEEAQKLKYENIPNNLYRYREFNTYTIENLVKEQEWQSYPCEFNDPFDSRLKIDLKQINKNLFSEKTLVDFIKDMDKQGISFSEEDLQDIQSSDKPFYALAKHVATLEPELQGKEEEFANTIFEITDKQSKKMFEPIRTAFQTGYLIVCFSEKHNNTLMWSHYAKKHSGFCIEYNFKELGPHIALTRILAPVIYSDDLFDATQYFMEPIVKDYSPNNLFGIYTSISKETKWAYEHEWRTVWPLGPGADQKQRLLKVPTPKALYVGSKASKENVDILKEIAEQKKVPLYQMILDDESFGLNENLLYTPHRP